MSDLIQAAKDKAAATIAKAEQEQAALDLLPAGLNAEPRVMIFKGVPHISYKNAPTLLDVLAIYDAFDVIPGHDCKGTFRGVYAEPRDDVQGVYPAHVRLQASHNTGSTAKFTFFAKLSSGQTAQVSVDFDSSEYARKYQGQAWHDGLGYGFTWYRAERGCPAHWEVTRGATITDYCAATVSFNTGGKSGESVCIYGMFEDRAALAAALEDLAA